MEHKFCRSEDKKVKTLEDQAVLILKMHLCIDFVYA
jgi:hypothetical protein